MCSHRLIVPYHLLRSLRAIGRKVEKGAQLSRANLRLMIVDHGWFGYTPLHRHVVICGFPRSGSTLLALMMRCCVDNAFCYDAEVSALWAARFAKRNHRFMVTKQPDDVYNIHAVREYYRLKRPKPLFVLTIRDPRAVLTSRHVIKDGYYVDPGRWRSIWNALPIHGQLPEDVLIIRYEDLVLRCRQVQKSIREFVGWEYRYNFDDFRAHVPRTFDTSGLNGVRELDKGTIDKWRAPEHAERIKLLLEVEFPEMCERLTELGYEKNHAWIDQYAKCVSVSSK